MWKRCVIGAAILGLCACSGPTGFSDAGDGAADARSDGAAVDGRSDVPVVPDVTDATTGDTPVMDAPASDTPALDVQTGDGPATDTGALDVPGADTPGADIPALDVPVRDAGRPDVSTDVGPGGCLDNSGCSAREYCAAAMCAGPGTCAVRPEACTLIYDPVCGCDGRTYGNACGAASAGVRVDYRGMCGTTTPDAGAGCPATPPRSGSACSSTSASCRYTDPGGCFTQCTCTSGSWRCVTACP